MAWTTTDRDTVQAAIRTALSEGVASVSVGGQTVQTYTLKDLTDLLAVIEAGIATANNRPGLGLRFQQITPVYR